MQQDAEAPMAAGLTFFFFFFPESAARTLESPLFVVASLHSRCHPRVFLRVTLLASLITVVFSPCHFLLLFLNSL